MEIQLQSDLTLICRHANSISVSKTIRAEIANKGMAANIKVPPKRAQGLTLRQAPGNKAGKKADEAWRRLKNITQPDTNENKMPAPNTNNST